MIGLILGMNVFSYHASSLEFHQHQPREHSGQEGNAQVDEDALGDLPMRDLRQVDVAEFDAQERRQHRDEQPGVDAVEEHLEDAVERHQPGAVFRVALGQIVPHDHHRDAARQADQDQADHVLGIAAQEQDGEQQNIRIGPMTQFCTSDSPSTFQSRNTSPSSSYFTLASGGYIIRIRPMAMGMLVVAHLEAVDERPDAGQEVSQPDADRHRQENPDGQIAIEEGQSATWRRPLCSSETPIVVWY